MAGRPPGSHCHHSRPGNVKDGTSALTPSPHPGPTCRLSEELRDACALPDFHSRYANVSAEQKKVLAWLHNHRKAIAEAEARWGVDRRAIAGAIAWEALYNVEEKNPHFASLYQWNGVGKVHYKNWATVPGIKVFGHRIPLPYKKITLAEQVEKKGYLPHVSEDGRADLLKDPGQSITYIAACMRAQADAVASFGYSDIYENPGMLANFYNGWDLDDIAGHFQGLGKAEAQLQNKSSRSLKVGNAMGQWVSHHFTLWMLEEAVGKPHVPKPPPDVLKTALHQAKLVAEGGANLAGVNKRMRGYFTEVARFFNHDIVVTSGYRDPAGQAKAMYENWPGVDYGGQYPALAQNEGTISRAKVLHALWCRGTGQVVNSPVAYDENIIVDGKKVKELSPQEAETKFKSRAKQWVHSKHEDGEALDVRRGSVSEKMRKAIRMYFRELEEKHNTHIWHYDTQTPGKPIDQVPEVIDEQLKKQWGAL